MRRLLLLMLGLSLLTAGCVPNTNGVASDDKLVEDKTLVGEFTDKSSKWIVKAAAGKKYELTMKEGNTKTGVFQASLVKLGDHHYLDITPTESSQDSPGFHESHFLALHTFYRIEKTDDDSLQLWSLDPNWVHRLLRKEPDALKHFNHGQSAILTAETPQLQEFVLKHQDNKDAWLQGITVKRVR